MAITLLQLRTQARQQADMEGSIFVADAEANSYVNSSAAELYDLLVTVGEDQFTALVTSVGALTSPINLLDIYAACGVTVPAGQSPRVHKLVWVDYQVNGDWVSLKPFVKAERNRTKRTVMGLFDRDDRKYHIVGNKLYIYPETADAGIYRFAFVPAWLPLVLDTDTMDDVQAWTEYVIVDVAIKMLQKEESDTSAMMARKAGLAARIRQAASNRDMGSPQRVGDVTDAYGWEGRYP